MTLDPYRIVAFLHVVLFAYWLGADLGVMLCSRIARRSDLSDDARRAVRSAGHLIDMGPRTALVLMVPAGLILASQYGSPVQGPWLAAIAVAAAGWLWMVWTIFLQPQTPLGKLLWKIDMGWRIVLMTLFVGFGVKCLITGAPIADHWLAAKFVVFGLILMDGIYLRLVLIRMERDARAGNSPAPGAPPTALMKSLHIAVMIIWALVAIAAFLGIVKPF